MNRLAIALSLPVGAALLLQANPSQAFTPINVNGSDYNIETFSGTLTEFLAFLNAPPPPPSSPSVPWYGDSSLAGLFASALYAVEGPTSLQNVGDASALSGQISIGPLFYTGTSDFVAYYDPTSSPSAFTCNLATAVDCETSPINWAVVQQNTAVPTPAPLPFLGATAAFSFSRKLRRRLSAQKFIF